MDARPSNIRPLVDEDEASYLNSTYLNVHIQAKEPFPIPTLEYAIGSLYQPFCHLHGSTVLDLYESTLQQGFDIVFAGYQVTVGIIEQRASGQSGKVGDDASAASCSAIGYEGASSCIYIFKIWQESWSQQLDNKLHSVKPVIGAWLRDANAKN
ncbi:hypothetical protein TNCV_4032551 [Trichonephila clavipes]|nr:hypothetical protein TNCV_4032551 [Trichonephila clavipes]